MTSTLQHPHPPRVKKWTQEEYLDLVERGAFHKQRVYLFRGDIIEMAPQGHPHAYGIMKLNRYLTDTFKPPYEVRIQLPFVTPGQSVPEPDAAVCSEADAARRPHPAHAELVVEVSYSSLAQDRALAEEYAAAGVPEYWIIDTDTSRVEVYRQPAANASAALGFRYAEVRTFNVGGEIAPAAHPLARLPIAVLFD